MLTKRIILEKRVFLKIPRTITHLLSLLWLALLLASPGAGLVEEVEAVELVDVPKP